MTYFPKKCDCGQTRVNGKCRVCDAVEVVKPHQRQKALNRKLREREQHSRLLFERKKTGT